MEKSLHIESYFKTENEEKKALQGSSQNPQITTSTTLLTPVVSALAVSVISVDSNRPRLVPAGRSCFFMIVSPTYHQMAYWAPLPVAVSETEQSKVTFW